MVYGLQQLQVERIEQPLAQSFVDFALSPQGQQTVTQDGWITTAAP